MHSRATHAVPVTHRPATTVPAATTGPAWRRRVVAAGLTPPDIATQVRPLALVDSQADVSLPGFVGGNVSTMAADKVTSEHGTATLSVAAAPDTGTGMEGLWPGMKAVNIPTSLTCGDIVLRLRQAITINAAAVNMSYGSSDFCYSEYLALERAVRAGVVPVAAAGNEFDQGNPAEYPASLPHVLTIGSLGANDSPSYFSNENAAVDLSAPGESILTLVPLAFDDDGTRDGLDKLDGTSFAAPIVAAATTWVRAARPDLTVDQLTQVIRLSAHDLGSAGWDSSTGYGRLDVQAALTEKAPTPDVAEPNDDIQFVNGSAFGTPATPIVSKAVPAASFTAYADRYEDPADVYRVSVPAHQTLDIRVKPAFGDVDLELYGNTATSVDSSRGRFAASRRNGRTTDRIVHRNRTSHTQVYLANVYIDTTVNTLDSRYTVRASVAP